MSFVSHHSILSGNKLINFPCIESVSPMMVVDKLIPCLP